MEWGDLERRAWVGSSSRAWDAGGFGKGQLGEAGLWVSWSWRGDGPMLPGWGWGEELGALGQKAGPPEARAGGSGGHCGWEDAKPDCPECGARGASVGLPVAPDSCTVGKLRPREAKNLLPQLCPPRWPQDPMATPGPDLCPLPPQWHLILGGAVLLTALRPAAPGPTPPPQEA